MKCYVTYTESTKGKGLREGVWSDKSCTVHIYKSYQEHISHPFTRVQALLEISEDCLSEVKILVVQHK